MRLKYLKYFAPLSPNYASAIYGSQCKFIQTKSGKPGGRGGMLSRYFLL